MKIRSPREKEDERLLAQRAAEWAQVLKTAGDCEQAEFADWLAESPRHVEEYLMITALDRQVRQLPLKSNPQIQALLARASSSVVPLRSGMNRVPSRALAVLASRSIQGLAAGLCAVAVIGWLWWAQGLRYSTEIGEQRVVMLADGSKMSMTAGTQTRIRFSDGRRDVFLLAGEALFNVAKDSTRPFVVHSADSRIQAIGTQFNVLRRLSGTTVSVLEGAVKVEGQPTDVARPDALDLTTLHAGDEVRIATDGRIVKRTKRSEMTVEKWRQRRLVFHADALPDIAAEFNRYNQAPRMVVDESVASEPRYTGVFDADDPQSLLAFLQEDQQIALERRGNELIIRARQ